MKKIFKEAFKARPAEVLLDIAETVVVCLLCLGLAGYFLFYV